MNLLDPLVPACWTTLYSIEVKGADGKRRVLPRTLPREAPHVVRENRLWVARAPGHRSGIGYSPSHALEELLKPRNTAPQEARGPLMTPLGQFPLEADHVPTP